VQIYPVLVDSRPAYLRGRGRSTSLLLVPLGRGTVIEHLHSCLQSVTPNPPVVLAPADVGPGYAPAVHEACPPAHAVCAPEELVDLLGTYEPSDALLVVDALCLPAGRLDLRALVDSFAADPRWAIHLIALQQSASGTKEQVSVDAAGRVRRIQRYYDTVTWPFIAGTAASLLPVACGLIGQDGRAPGSLAELRLLLAGRGVPSRDVPLEGGALDLSDEAGLLAASEAFIVEATAGRNGRSVASIPVLVGNGHQIHPTVRIIGPVILHPDASLEERVMVVGPALIGAGARIGAGAVVAQAVVAPDLVVPPGSTVRHRALFDDLSAEHSRKDPSPRHYEETGPRFVPAPDEDRGRDASRLRYMRLKRTVDAILAAAALVILSPLLLAIAVLIRLGSKGSIVYGHPREGRNGQVFPCWKFRTMFEGAEARQRELYTLNQIDGPQFKLDRDPRLTWIGWFLRATNLDELPQLINVVRGEMSLVGPRPSPFRENQLCIPWRHGRLSVRPGITGLWQVCRHDRAAGDFHQWIEYDLLYVEHISAWLDLKILVATLLTLGGKRHVPLAWILVRRREHSEGGVERA